MSTTIRMRRCFDWTLNGYVFSDLKHARQWLSSWSKPEYISQIVLEEVEAGPFIRCSRCNGAGSHRKVKVLRKMTFEEVMSGV